MTYLTRRSRDLRARGRTVQPNSPAAPSSASWATNRRRPDRV